MQEKNENNDKKQCEVCLCRGIPPAMTGASIRTRGKKKTQQQRQLHLPTTGQKVHVQQHQPLATAAHSGKSSASTTHRGELRSLFPVRGGVLVPPVVVQPLLLLVGQRYRLLSLLFRANKNKLVLEISQGRSNLSNPHQKTPHKIASAAESQ